MGAPSVAGNSSVEQLLEGAAYRCALLAAQPVCCLPCCASPLQPPDDLISAGPPLLLGGALHSRRGCICWIWSRQLVQNPAPEGLFQGLQLSGTQLLCLQQGSSQILWVCAAVPERTCRKRSEHSLGGSHLLCLQQGISQVMWAWAAVPERTCRNRVSIPHSEADVQGMHLRHSISQVLGSCAAVL